MWIQEFLKINPYFLIHRQISIEEIVAGLKAHYGAVEMPQEEIPALAMHKFNAVHLPRNEELGLTEGELNIQAVKIPIRSKTAHYTWKNYVPQPEEDFIYLAYEIQVGYCQSNSNKLFLETAIARGLAPEVRDGEDYYDYLHYLQTYLECYIAPYVQGET